LLIDTTAPTIGINTIAGDNIITQSEAANASGITISGTAVDGGSGVNGQTVTVKILNSSNATLDTYTTQVSNGTWSVNVTKTQAQALADGTDTVTANVSDAAGNAANQATQPITVHEIPPTINAPTSQTVQPGTPTPVPVSIAESSDTTGETYTVTLSDTYGVLTATGTGVSGSGSTSLTISGSLSQVNTALGTLKDADSTLGADTITLNASDSPFGNVATQKTINITASNAVPPTGFVFTPNTAALQSLQVSFLQNNYDYLKHGVQLGTFTQAGGTAGDTFTFTMGGTNIGSFAASAATNAETLAVGSSNLSASGSHGQAYALTVQVNDATNSTHSSALPFDVVVANGSSSTITINLEQGSQNLGIGAATPTIVYGLGDEASSETINAAGMTAYVWFVGGISVATMTGGSGINTYLFSAPGESAQSAGDVQTITNFNMAKDIINISAISTVNKVQGLLTSTSTNVSANSIAWVQNGTSTDIFINPTSSSKSQTSSSVMEIVLGTFTATALTDSTSSHPHFVFTGGPAGIAGQAIDLGLSDPSNGAAGPITVGLSGLPAGWVVSGGTDEGNGTWSVQTHDAASVSVVSPSTYGGALKLDVTETWTNPDGSLGVSTTVQNVEAYASGNPVFAWAGNDTLTGAGGHGTYVFGPAMGIDAIYNFTIAGDKIDLVGLENASSFADLQAHVTQDGNGDAVIAIDAGQTITLHGVSAASLTAGNFEFDHTPTVENAGTMTVSDDAILPLGGIINNAGAIVLTSTGNQTELEIVGSGITLEGAGHVTLAGDALIAATGSADTLTNVDNTIAGAGQIGTGDGTLTLANEAHGTIDAHVAGASLLLDTGATIANAGVLAAANGGTLLSPTA
jgi:hypothetical protein